MPTNKIPLLDWTSLRAGYNSKYNWLAASLLARELGNKLSNTQTRTLNGELKWEELYNKNKSIRALQNGMGTARTAAAARRTAAADAKKDKVRSRAVRSGGTADQRTPAPDAFGQRSRSTADTTRDNTYVDGQQKEKEVAAPSVFAPTTLRYRYDTIRKKMAPSVRSKNAK